MTKQALRKEYKEKRALLSNVERTLFSNQICAQVLSLFSFENKYIHLFLPIEKHHEIDTFPLIDAIQERKGKVVVSKTHWETNELTHILLEKTTKLTTNEWGIPEPQSGKEIEPAKLDIIFIPLLVCDESGFRVGYGKGFYDRFLAQCSPTCLFVGLNFFDTCPIISDLHKDDIPLHQLITPQKHFYFEQ